jgi:hypothetical protein
MDGLENSGAEQVEQTESKKEKKHGPNKGSIIDAASFKGFLLDPDDPRLKIVGLDTDHKEGEHHLYDRRINLPLNDRFVEYMMDPEVGFDSVIQVEKDGDDILVKKGRQRVRHAREANKRLRKLGRTPLRIRCTFEKDDDKASIKKKFGENAHRFADKPMETARNIREFMNAGYSEEEASITFNTSVENVALLLKLLDLDPSIQAAVDRGDFAASTVAPLAELSRDKQKAEFTKLKERADAGLRVSPKEVKAQTRAARSGSDEVIVPPSKRLLDKILKNDFKDRKLPADVRKALLWVTGEVSTNRAGIAGLTELEREANAQREKAQAKKAAKKKSAKK